ncbi:MAG: hypothetical protein DRQ24_09455 [Candidatus Latescibacterota bacterium]|nr:MAG: hypothetical protein DRQ24_09455 [Candidatus Latescibacterota bacterium]
MDRFVHKEKNIYEIFSFAIIVFYVIFFCIVCFLKFRSYSYVDFDLAIDSQTLYNILHGSLISSIHRIVFLGNHMRLILFLVAPFYFIFPSPLLLLFLQTIFLGLTAWPIFLLARDVLDEKTAFFIVVLYIFYPPLAYLNLYEFHPTALSVFFLMWGCLFYYRGAFRGFILFSSLAMACQENISLLIVMFGIYSVFLKRRFKWFLVPFFSGSVYFFLSVFLIMPHFNKGTIQFVHLYSYLGGSFGEIFKNMFFHPARILRYCVASKNINFLVLLLSPLGFVPLLGGEWLLLNLPIFLQHFLSLNPSHTQVIYHYQAEHIPFIFAGLIFGVKRLFLILKSGEKQKNILYIVLLCFCFLSFLVWGPYVELMKDFSSGRFRKDGMDVFRDSLIEGIEEDKGVMASFEFLPKLSNRRHLYSFHHLYSGRYTFSQKKYTLPEDVDYVIFDTSDRLLSAFYKRDNYLNLQPLRARYTPYAVLGGVVALGLKEKVKNSRDLFQVYTPPVGDIHPASQKAMGVQPWSEIRYKTNISLENSVLFQGINCKKEKGILEISFFWECLRPSHRDIWLTVGIYDTSGHLLFRGVVVPCYLFYPTQAWNKGEYVKDNHWLPLSVDSSLQQIRITFFDMPTGAVLGKVVIDLDRTEKI